MARTVVRVAGPRIYRVPMLKARRVADRLSL
jgi:hypothetical protein